MTGNGSDATRTTTLALYGGRDLTDRLSIDGSARWTHGNGGEAFRGTDFNIGLNWRLTPRWSLSAAFYQSRGSRRSPFILDPLVTETPFISLPRNRSVFLTLRYERSAGRPPGRSEEHTSELPSLMRISYAVFLLKKT